MLTRTTTRSSAVVLTMALVAMFLVVLAGPARIAQARVSAGPGQANPAPQPGRHTTAVVPAPNDQSMWHLDLASTPPIIVETATAIRGEHVTTDAASLLTTDAIAAVGRAPPAL